MSIPQVCPTEGTYSPSAPTHGEGHPSGRIPSNKRSHLIPESDLREHELHPNCWCVPNEVGRSPLFGKPVFIHKPLDGRDR